MWELTQAWLSFSWAMSLFGVQQMANLLEPAEGAKGFRIMVQAAEAGLSRELLAAFRAGDSLQRRFTGVARRPSTPGEAHASPRSAGKHALDIGHPDVSANANAAQPSAPSPAAEAPSTLVGATPADGWGPMPDSQPAPQPARESESESSVQPEEGWGPMPG